jgi:hypothetical protein
MLASRPSTVVRNARLGALIAALSARKMTLAEMALLLQCSQSAVRQYVRELSRADVVLLANKQKAGAGGCGKSYSLNNDPSTVNRFLDSLTEPPDGRARVAGRSPRLPASLASPRYVHEVFEKLSGRDVDEVRARRDPLVAALFGASTGVGQEAPVKQFPLKGICGYTESRGSPSRGKSEQGLRILV